MTAGESTKAALVTGCFGDIGKALVKAFSEAGYSVIGTDIRSGNDELADATIQLDLQRLVMDEDYRRDCIAAIRARIGERPFGALVNNAATQRTGRLQELSSDAWLETYAVNVLAPAVLTAELLPELTVAKGAVVNVSSVHAILTKPGFAAYASSKAALNGLTRSLAIECGPDVRVNAVQPEAVDTAMLRAGFSDMDKLAELDAYHPSGRIGLPAEVASVCVHLCSDQASFVTGAVVPIDGGIGGRLHDPV